jgi:hypothetical protein
MDFHASKERADFPFGHLRPGDLVTVKFFVTYRLRDGKVAELKSMTWPPGKGVSQLPRLGPHPSQLAAFHSYVSAFNNADFDRFAAFYTEDVQLERESSPPIRGRQAVIDFYRAMFERARADLTVNSVSATPSNIELDAMIRFKAIKDVPGECVDGRVLVSYQLRDGLIASILARRGEAVRR